MTARPRIDPAFHDLCHSVCELMGVQTPPFEQEDEHVHALNFMLDEVRITLMHLPLRARESLFILAELGPVPTGDALEAWHVMLDANLLLLEDRAPVFARNPANGEAVLRLCLPLHGLPAHRVYQRVQQLARATALWRLNPLAPADSIRTTSETAWMNRAYA